MITVVTTPNPHAMKFIIGSKWISFAWECANEKTAKKSPLARALWNLNGVNYLLFGLDFVSVNKRNDISWLNLQPEVIDIIDDFLKKDIGLFESTKESHKEEMKLDDVQELTELEEKIIKVIEEKVQPSIESHGGMVKFISFKNGILILDLQGACKGCPSSAVTLKGGIENLLKYYFPEILKVESV